MTFVLGLGRRMRAINRPANKPLERPSMNALRPTDGVSAGRSAPSR
jgi:hypothetical protein